MNLLFPAPTAPKDRIQNRLFQLAATFLFIYSAVLTLAPAVRLHSWAVSYRWHHWLGYIAWLLGWILVNRISSKSLPERDPYLLPIAGLMTGWGLLTIWRLDEYFGYRQTLWLAVSLILLIIGLRSHKLLNILRKYKYIWLTTGLLLMVLTFIIGLYPSGEGPRLWLGCCGIYLQPSEPLKFLLVIYLAGFLSERVPLRFQLIPLIVPSLVLTSAALTILLAQRDLGAASLFVMIYAAIIFIASGHRRIAIISLAVLLAAGFIGYRLFDVIRLRVDAWLNPWADPAGGSYQIIQSLQAIATGGFLGSGPGLGSPGLVPVAQSDFIYAAISEETGLLGAFALLLLIGLFTGRGLITAARSPNLYNRFLAAGFSLSIALQSLLIIGGNIRLFPLTGVTLPFFSYGGSSLVTSILSLLMVEIISNQTEAPPAELTQGRTFLYASGGILVLLMAAGTLNLWWSIFRGSALLKREDNLRPVITDRYVLRGSLVDRNNQPINQTTGVRGDYSRQYLVPSLGTLVGYTHPSYGLFGLEASLDAYLRGLDATPSSTIWLDRILYSQTPLGNNIRLTLDLSLQSIADSLLSDHSGALVLLNADTGEILAASSQPGIDPSQLDEKAKIWKDDPSSPYLDRVLQGKYPAGAAVGAMLRARLLQLGFHAAVSPSLSTSFSNQVLDCALEPQDPTKWGSVISAGCPGAVLYLANRMTPDQISAFYQQLGFYETSSLPLAQASADQRVTITDPSQGVFGSASPRVTPLQMALAVASITHSGIRPAPRLTLAVQTPAQGWVAFAQTDVPVQAFTPDKLSDAVSSMQLSPLPAWYSVSRSYTTDQVFTWFIAGTLPGWQGSPLALAVVLEEDNPEGALKIGSNLLDQLLKFEPGS